MNKSSELKRINSDFDGARAGERVWSIRSGWGTIVFVNSVAGRDRPIEVQFDSGKTDFNRFYLDGRLAPDHVLPELYWDIVSFDVPKAPERQNHTAFNGAFSPNENEMYVYPDIYAPDLWNWARFSINRPVDVFRSKNGLCFSYTEAGHYAASGLSKQMLKSLE